MSLQAPLSVQIALSHRYVESKSHCSNFSPTVIHRGSGNGVIFKTLSPLRYGSYEDSGRGPSLKVIISGLVLTFGIFGFGFMTPISNMLKQFSAEQQGKVSNVELKKSSSEPNRGAMTSLTKREINEKLAQVPIFYAVGKDGAISTSDGIGLFFVNKNDADEFAKNNNLKVSATSLDNVYYTLIVKKLRSLHIWMMLQRMQTLLQPISLSLQKNKSH